MVASIGNSGASGLYSAGAPGVGKKVIGVASFDNTARRRCRFFTISPDDTPIGYNQATGAPRGADVGHVADGAHGHADDCRRRAAAALPPGSLTGKVALIRRGTCSFYDKAINAQNAGAAAVVLYNNVAGPHQPDGRRHRRPITDPGRGDHPTPTAH